MQQLESRREPTSIRQTLGRSAHRHEEAVITASVHAEGVQIEDQLRAVHDELRALQAMLAQDRHTL